MHKIFLLPERCRRVNCQTDAGMQQYVTALCGLQVTDWGHTAVLESAGQPLGPSNLDLPPSALVAGRVVELDLGVLQAFVVMHIPRADCPVNGRRLGCVVAHKGVARNVSLQDNAMQVFHAHNWLQCNPSL